MLNALIVANEWLHIHEQCEANFQFSSIRELVRATTSYHHQLR